MTKTLEWVLGLWLAGITVRYCATLWKTLDHPLNPGNDVQWFGTWGAVCAALLISATLLQSRTFIRVALVVVAAAAAVILTLSQAWLPAIAGLWLVLASGGLGLVVLNALRVEMTGVAERIALAVPLGMAALGLALFVLAVSNLLQTIPIVCLLLAATLIGGSVVLRGTREVFAAPVMKISREAGLLTALIAFAALLNLTWAVVPEIHFDALNYHLAMPKMYLNAGGLVDGRFLQSYLVKTLELLFSACIALAGQTAAKLFSYLLGLCAAIATYAFGASLFNRRVGIWAAAMFYTTPLVGWLVGTTYVDHILAFFSAAGFLSFVKWFRSRDARWFYVACVIAGLAVGSKLNTSFAFAVVLPVMAIGLRREMRVVALGSALFFLVASPFYVVAWQWTGNPIFPLFNGLFKSPLWPADNAIFNAHQFGLPITVSNLLRFPFRLTFDSVRFGEALPRGAVGLSLLLFFPFALRFVRQAERSAVAIVAAAMAYLVALFYTMQYGRYYIVILPVVAVVGVATVLEALSEKGGGKKRFVQICLLAAILIQFPALSIQYWNIPERFPLSVALGIESRDAFLRRALDGYAAAVRINAGVQPGERVLGVDVEGLRLYLAAPLDTLPISVLGSDVRKLSDMKPGPELAAGIQRAGYKRLLVRTAALSAPAAWYPYLDKEFMESYTTLEFREGQTSVYRFQLTGRTP